MWIVTVSRLHCDISEYEFCKGAQGCNYKRKLQAKVRRSNFFVSLLWWYFICSCELIQAFFVCCSLIRKNTKYLENIFNLTPPSARIVSPFVIWGFLCIYRWGDSGLSRILRCETADSGGDSVGLELFCFCRNFTRL